MVGRIANSGVRVVGDLEALTLVPEDGGTGDHAARRVHSPGYRSVDGHGHGRRGGAARGRPGVNALAAGAGSMTPGAAPSPDNNGEPAGLGRFSTYHLLGTIGMRSVSRVFRWMDRYGRPSHWPRSGRRTSPRRRRAGAHRISAMARRRRVRAGRWRSIRRCSSARPSLGCRRRRAGTWRERRGGMRAPTGGGRHDARAAGRAGPGHRNARRKLRAARLPWAEPPELAVVTTPRLAWVGVRRILRSLRSG